MSRVEEVGRHLEYLWRRLPDLGLDPRTKLYLYDRVRDWTSTYLRLSEESTSRDPLRSVAAAILTELLSFFTELTTPEYLKEYSTAVDLCFKVLDVGFTAVELDDLVEKLLSISSLTRGVLTHHRLNSLTRELLERAYGLGRRSRYVLVYYEVKRRGKVGIEELRTWYYEVFGCGRDPEEVTRELEEVLSKLVSAGLLRIAGPGTYEVVSG